MNDQRAATESRQRGLRRAWQIAILAAVIVLLPLGILLATIWDDLVKQSDQRGPVLSIENGDAESTPAAGASQLTSAPQIASPERQRELLAGAPRREVRQLDLSTRNVHDTDLAWLGGLPALTELKVSGAGVTDAGLAHLQRATNLKRLDLRNTAVTAEGVQSLQRALPDLEVLHDLIAEQAAEAFRRRYERHGLPPVGDVSQRPAMETESAIEQGLRYLARRQWADGRWSLQGGDPADPAMISVREPAALHADTSATGLALLAFLGAGYQHKSGAYAHTVRGGLDFLIDRQSENGDLYSPNEGESSSDVVWLYSHGIAAIALCEAYGMTGDEQLRRPAQRALDFIVATQHPELGGWRYAPQTSSDTSVTGWLMMALQSGRLAGLEVPQQTMDRAEKWLDMAQYSEEEPHLYVYNPQAPNTQEQGHGRMPNRTMTSVGLLMRLYTGWSRDDERLVAGADYLRQNLPMLGSTAENQRDSYYWYYGTQVMFHMGGDYWDAWDGQLRNMLLSEQIRDGDLAGSWNPRQPLPDRWAPQAGRLYVTTLNLLSLEVYYRHLPIYEQTAR